LPRVQPPASSAPPVPGRLGAPDHEEGRERLPRVRGPYAESGNVLFSDRAPSCTASSSTAATCKGAIDVNPQDELRNEDAGTRKASVSPSPGTA
jgi:hypothetical protein